MKHLLSVILKGFCVGGSMLVPGVSGGAMAIILGIYDDLIRAVSSFLRAPRLHGQFLLAFSLAAAAGMLLVSRPLLLLIEQFRQPTLYFFLGAVAGSIPMMLERAQPPRLRPQLLLWPLIGVLIVWLISLWAVEQAGLPDYHTPGFLILMLAGLFGAVALVLPGISMSFIWWLFDMYDSTMKAISDLDFSYLLPLGLGLLIGIFACARLLERAMTKHPTPTYLIILGFLVGSMIEVFPGLPSAWGWLACPLLFLLGLMLVYRLGKATIKK